MKERPIIFSGPMVRAILEGRKTQTRRVVKYRDSEAGFWVAVTYVGMARCQKFINVDRKGIHCPYGQPGDRLWVKETIRNAPEHANFYYAADSKGVGTKIHEILLNEYGGYDRSENARFMPRRACRFELDVNAVRLEPLQDISEDDVQAEGCTGSPLGTSADALLFPTLWDSINAKRGYGWDTNPWVWVVTFERAPGAEAARHPQD